MKTSILVLLATLAPSAQADDLQRLFYTPEQRAQMDDGIPQASAPEPAVAPKLNGMVQRSNGSRTLWLDGVMQDSDGREPLPIQVGQRIPARHGRDMSR